MPARGLLSKLELEMSPSVMANKMSLQAAIHASHGFTTKRLVLLLLEQIAFAVLQMAEIARSMSAPTSIPLCRKRPYQLVQTSQSWLHDAGNINSTGHA